MALWVLARSRARRVDNLADPGYHLADAECGKTTTLTALNELVPRALPSEQHHFRCVCYRAVEKWRPTLLIDEADTFLKDSDELRGIRQFWS